MKSIGTYQAREVFWFDYSQFQLDQLPQKDWLCFAICNIAPNELKFERLVRHSIDNGILEFKGCGIFGEKLHDIFDEIMVDIETTKNIEAIDIATTGHNDESLADVFWQCFFATTLPTSADLDNILIVCTDVEGNDRSSELKEIVRRFKEGWIPED